MSDLPAILGGTPIRTIPFTVEPMIGAEEEELVLQAVREHNFSRYIGATSPDIDDILVMTSEQTRSIKADWHYLGGPNVRAFGADFADWFGVDYAIPINSATSALSVALAAADVCANDEVIVPTLSFSATASSILMFDSLPRFVDIDPRTFCINVNQIEAAITPHTKAIMPVHLLGNSADMDAILHIAETHNLVVIEDASQSPGTKWNGRYVGTLGDVGVFSFQQSKNIMTGEGGMIVTNNPEIAKRARLIMNHGEMIMTDQHNVDELSNIIGFNFRMPELCAALGRAQIPRLNDVNAWRNKNYQSLVDGLSDIEGLAPPYIPNEVDYVCHVAAFRYDAETLGMERDLFLSAMRAEGIPIGTGYVRLMSDNPMFLKKTAYGKNGYPWSASEHGRQMTYEKNAFPIAQNLVENSFLWFYHIAYPSTSDDMQDIINAVRKVLANKEALISEAAAIRETGTGGRTQGRL